MNAIEQIDLNVDRLVGIANEYLGRGQAETLQQEHQTRKNESLLQIMLFGSYNAGKSSLINALVAENVANIGEIPETAEAERYRWNGCYLLDTPGVNAPIDHETVTEEEINRSELVLFVIRQGDQDVKDVYDRMFNMIARDKHVFIVFNHELGPEQMPEALRRLSDIMARYAGIYGVALSRVGGIPITPVNIKTAMKARLKGADRLAEHSGIVEFETEFGSWLRRFDDEHHYLDRLRKYVHQCLVAPLLEAIPKDIDSEKNAELRRLQHQRGEVIRQYDLLRSQVANHVRGEIRAAKRDIAQVIDKASSQAELEADMQELSDRVVASTTEFLRERCEGIIEDLTAVSNVDVDLFDDDAPESKKSEMLRQMTASGLENVAAQAKNLDVETIKKGLLYLRKLKIPGVKGRWEKTLGKWAGDLAKGAKAAGWVITAATSAYEVYSASSEQDKLNEEQRRQVLGVHQAIESVANDITSAILVETHEIIGATKDEAVTDLEARIEEMTSASEKHVRDREHVKRLAAGIDAIQI
ncbi:GTPase [Salinisphaera hydrothermalis]|uniref:GTPase n=1 Tax=Salinisphaera hydrothermalis TaxID=563188 RepID=UPI00333E78B5